MEKIIADLVKGAQASGGFMRGGKAAVELLNTGTEEKLASARASLETAYTDGIKAAQDLYKVSFVGQMATMLAGPAMRGLAGKVAPNLAKRVAGPVASTLFETAASAGAQRLMGGNQ
jgi:hypothetical protein